METTFTAVLAVVGGFMSVVALTRTWQKCAAITSSQVLPSVPPSRKPATMEDVKLRFKKHAMRHERAKR